MFSTYYNCKSSTTLYCATRFKEVKVCLRNTNIHMLIYIRFTYTRTYLLHPSVRIKYVLIFYMDVNSVAKLRMQILEINKWWWYIHHGYCIIMGIVSSWVLCHHEYCVQTDTYLHWIECWSSWLIITSFVMKTYSETS